MHACDLTSMRYFKIENWIQVNNHFKQNEMRSDFWYACSETKEGTNNADFPLPGYSQDIDRLAKKGEVVEKNNTYLKPDC